MRIRASHARGDRLDAPAVVAPDVIVSRGPARSPALLHLAQMLLVLCTGVLPGLALAAEKVWVELETPAQEETRLEGPVGLLEVRGWTGTGLRGGHDVLIAIDRSASVWKASGADIDGDGVTGRSRTELDFFLEYDRQSTDPGDTILRAEIEAARKLIERLDSDTTRMGLMSFANGARVHAPIGSSRSVLYDALRDLPLEPDFKGTSFENALKLARFQFEGQPRAEQPEDRRNLSVILLSDGAPTWPSPPSHAEKLAIGSAMDAAKLGVRIYAFALGPEAVSNRTVYEEITHVSGGDLVLVASPGEVTDFVPHMSLTKIARVEIDNLSSSQKARAVRLFPDGTFDGYAPLREGMNIIRITVVGEGGYEQVVDRRVYFTKTPTDSEERKAKALQLIRDLKIRTAETELAESARKRMEEERAGRSVTIEAESGDTEDR